MSCIFVLHCFSVDLSSSLVPSLLLAPFFLSAVCSCLLCGMLFINSTRTAAEQAPLTVAASVFFFNFGTTQWRVSVRRNAREADCSVCVCSAGLVCMKSSTSVVELVMLLCSQVGNVSVCCSQSALAAVLTLRLTPKPIYLQLHWPLSRLYLSLHHETSSLDTLQI